MSSCSIKWCGKNSKTSNYNTDGITFHRFPKDPDRKNAWIIATKRENWFPTTYSVICSRHFTSDCFEQIKGRRRLFATAIPTLWLPQLGAPEENTPSDEENPPTSPKALETTATDETSQGKIRPEQTDPTTSVKASTSKKILCRKITDLKAKLHKTKLVVKRLKDSNRILKDKVNTMKNLMEKLKNKKLITQENIDIDRLQNSNRQLRKKVIWLRQLLNEQKKKNLLNKHNVVWCPAPETEDTLVVDKE